MAASIPHPVRSISLPARSHPTSLKIEETIDKLKSRQIYPSDSTYCYSSGAESIQLSLLNLVELYARLQEFIASLSTQRWKVVEEALESSVSLLDTCSSARDLISGVKEQVCDLQSALRRKGYSSSEEEISMYTSFRKKVAKDVARCCKVLTQAEGRYGVTAPLLESDPSSVNLLRLLRETYTATIFVFRSLFFFLSTPTKASKWSLISKLITKSSRTPNIKEAGILNEVSEVDLALQNVSKVDVMLVRGKTQALDASLQILEGELGCLFRCLLQNRVSLLNILTH